MVVRRINNDASEPTHSLWTEMPKHVFPRGLESMLPFATDMCKSLISQEEKSKPTDAAKSERSNNPKAVGGSIS